MHLKPAGIYTGTKRHPGKRPGVHVPSPEGQAGRSHQLQEPSEKQPAHLPTRQWHMQLSICLSPGAHTSLQPSPENTGQGRHCFCGTPGSTCTSHTHHRPPCSCSRVTVKIHLQKPGLKLRRQKLSSNLGLWVRCRGIS